MSCLGAFLCELGKRLTFESSRMAVSFVSLYACNSSLYFERYFLTCSISPILRIDS